MLKTIKVFLCDDHTLFCQGIRKLLELEPDITVVGEARNGSEMLNSLKKTKPDIILMDIGMPEMDGVKATEEAKKILPDVNIIILTVYDDEPHIFQAIKVGAIGYLLKDISKAQLVEAIRRVYLGEALIQPAIATKVLREFASLQKKIVSISDKLYYKDLTNKEKEVLRFIALGGTNKEIAAKLGITEKTVKNHINHIFSTLHVNNRTQAAIYALGNI